MGIDMVYIFRSQAIKSVACDVWPVWPSSVLDYEAVSLPQVLNLSHAEQYWLRWALTVT